MAQFPPCPPSLQSVQHYLKIACEHDERDAVISYWCRYYALNCAMKIDKSSNEAKQLLFALMDWLEKEKKKLSTNEAITNDVAAHAHIENYAMKLFTWADSMDRASNFNKNTVKAFYTSGMLMDVLTEFGELSDEITQNRKYAKWKAAYIHNCLKNGETPVPGPMPGNEEGLDIPSNSDSIPASSGSGPSQPTPPTPNNTPNVAGFMPPPAAFPSGGLNFPSNPENNQTKITPPSPSVNVNPNFPEPADSDAFKAAPSNSSGMQLSPEKTAKAQKYCKWASSALNYDDIPEAISNLRKALHLLETGNDS